jgi:CRISPR-associated protein Cmr4
MAVKASIFRGPSTYLLADIVLIENLTNLHVGSGGVEGLVDLPIQRDEFGYPVIYSSSVKGSLKTCLLHTATTDIVYALFGPDPDESEKFESSVAILEGYLLAIPVRSLRGVYVYVTSPMLLKRFLERIELYTKFNQKDFVDVGSGGQEAKDIIGEMQNSFQSLIDEARERLSVDDAICLRDKQEVEINVKGLLEGCAILVEEFVLKILEPEREINSKLLDMLGFDKPLLLLHDDVAKEVVDRSLIRYTRVKLRRETKTVGEGPWTEEYLPVKSKFHTILLYKRPPLTDAFVKKILDGVEEVDDNAYLGVLKKLGILSESDFEMLKNSKEKKAQLLLVERIRNYVRGKIENDLKSLAVMGGKETLGKGIVKVNFLASRT